jgi:hypothetical protein
MNLKKLVLSFFFLMTSLTSITSSAYLTFLESGEIAEVGSTQVGVTPQFVLSNGGGFNLSAFLDHSLQDSLSLRAYVGSGNTDFWSGVSLKWVPIPDFEQQPAIGVRSSLNIVRDEKESYFALQLSPFVSKKYSFEAGEAVPFIALNVNHLNGKITDVTGFQLVAGSEYKNPNWNSISLAAELGMNMSKSFTYFAVSVSAPLELLTSKNKQE